MVRYVLFVNHIDSANQFNIDALNIKRSEKKIMFQ